MLNLLLADDDNELTELLSEYLNQHQVRCDIVDNGEDALKQLQKKSYDLMVLDIMMPQMDGLSVLKNLPPTERTPVIMLTAKGDEIDRIIGLELGADDYIAKPCNPRELLARIKAVVKRTQNHPNKESDEFPNSLIQLDSEQRTCHINDVQIDLTGTEFDLLYELLKQKGQIVDKEQLSQTVLQRELQPFDRSIDVHISRLRKKLEFHHPKPIQSIRGRGYSLTI